MTSSDPSEDAPLTEWLQRWSEGDPQASREVFEGLYRDLRAIAARHLRNERPGHTLQATAIVHEAFLRFSSQSPVAWESRTQFLAYSARVIRQVLVDHARGRNRKKRGSGVVPVCLDEASAELGHDTIDILELHDALERLADSDAEKAAVVELRFFGGLTTNEIAAALGLSRVTVVRQWRRARAWLYNRLVIA